MEVKLCFFSALLIVSIVLVWKALKFVWLRPKEMERCLRKQGIKGNPYKPFLGDIMEHVRRTKDSMLKPINFSDDPIPRILAFLHHTIQTHGRNCFTWIGTTPWLIICDPDKIKEIITNYEDFCKSDDSINKIAMVGIFSKEGDTWAKHRKIINPAFRMDKLKNVCHTMYESCNMMMNSWEEILASKDGSSELDVLPFLENLSGDFISRAAFGTSYEQVKHIFDLQTEYVKLSLLNLQGILGWSYLPTKNNRRVNKITKDMEATLTRMIESRKATIIKDGASTSDDLLGILLESNMCETKEKSLTTKEVAHECQFFYLAGSETTSSLLVWTLILLSKHPIWQDRARTEVLQVFGKDGQPTFDGLNRLKIITMILHEVLRLYTPGYMLMRKVYKDVQLQELLIPEGTCVIIPLCVVHRDTSLWGKNANEFNPERFAEGVSEATKGEPIYYPFSVGPRICIGKNFALLEAKLTLTMILQRFSFDVSPTYVHAPYAIITTKPQHGANLVLSKLHY